GKNPSRRPFGVLSDCVVHLYLWCTHEDAGCRRSSSLRHLARGACNLRNARFGVVPGILAVLGKPQGPRCPLSVCPEGGPVRNFCPKLSIRPAYKSAGWQSRSLS